MQQVKRHQVVEEPMSSTTDRKGKIDQADPSATRNVGRTQPDRQQQNQNFSPGEGVNEQQQQESKEGHQHGQGCGCG